MRLKTIIIGLVAAAAAVAVFGLPSPQIEPPGEHGTTTVPRGPSLPRSQINLQDRTSPAAKRRESQSFDTRPLLNVLPADSQDVSFDIGGLSADKKKTVIAADAHGLGRRRAITAYRALRQRIGDDSRTYELRIAP